MSTTTQTQPPQQVEYNGMKYNVKDGRFKKGQIPWNKGKVYTVDEITEKFWSKVKKTNACWLWQGSKSSHTPRYGLFHIHFKQYYAHRFAYELLKAPIPEGLTLDHLCRNTLCVNPAHLEPVSIGENVLRGESLFAQRARQTHCVHGHPLSGENLYIRPDGRGRGCLTCRDEVNRRRHLK